MKQFQAKHFFLASRQSLSTIQDFCGTQMFIIVLVNTQVTCNKFSVLSTVICAPYFSIIGEFSEHHLYRRFEDLMFKNLK
jgi:hypothetical protein